MMKTKLKFFLVLLAALICGGNSAWAQNETYEFATWGGYSGATLNMVGAYPGIASGSVITGQYASTITTTSNGTLQLNNRFAFRPYTSSSNGNGWALNSNGLFHATRTKTPDFVICNLRKGDKAKVTFTGQMAWNDGAETPNSISSNQELTANDNGEISLKSTQDGTKITKVEIYYAGNQTYTFTGISSECSIQPAAANSDIQPGASNSEAITIDGESGFVLDFTDKTYCDHYFNQPDNRFFIKESGWKINNKGLQMETGDGGYYAFYILDLNVGDRVSVNLQSNGSSATQLAKFWSENTGNKRLDPLMSGTEYVMQESGILKLLVYKGVSVTSVTISPSQIRFSKLKDTYDLVNLGYTEPTLIGVPSGTSVTYSTSEPKIARINNNAGATPGDLMIINTGTVRIEATATINGVVNKAYYDLTVIAAEAFWDIKNGNECYFPGAAAPSTENTGKLLVRRVTSVPHMTMEFGDASSSNLTMVTFRQNVRAANLIDENGWQHVWVENQSDYTMKPHQGTFYIFKPSISGKLTIKGIRNHTGSGANTVVLVDANASTGNTWHDDYSAGKRTRYYEQITQNGTTNEGNKYYSYIIVKTLSFATEGTYETTEEQVDLTGGHTYYLYANTPRTKGYRVINRDANPITDETIGEGSNDWQNFYLTGFKYETNFKFPYQNVIMGSVGTKTLSTDTYHRIPFATSYAGLSAGTGSITYTIRREGNITATINESTGALSDIGAADGSKQMGGAIVVTATLREGSATSKTSYVLTVPYTTINDGGKQRWVFNLTNYDYNNGSPTGTNQMESIEKLTTNALPSEWSIQYKVRNYDKTTKALYYINVPVLANALDVRGDNARYIGTTAGLIFNADANTFGTTASVKETEYKVINEEIIVDGETTHVDHVYRIEGGSETLLTNSADIDVALKTLLDYNVSDLKTGSQCYYVTMENGTSMTIPNLKKGQYIRIKWSRYSPNHGDIMSVTNVTDLAGVTITKPITIGAGGNVNRNGGTGYHEFIVEANGDVTFTLSQDGWANIYEIDVDNEFIPTDLKLEEGLALIRKASSSTTFTNAYTINWGDVLCQSNTLVQYAIKSGTATGTLDGKLSVVNNPDDENTTNNPQRPRVLNVGAGGHGRFVLHQKGYVQSTDRSASYLLDQNEHLIKVYEYDYSQKPYPWTWNMENMSTATATALSTDNSLTDGSNNYKTWKSNATGKYQLTLEPENVISWSTKSTIDGSQTAISELDGLGIRPADITKTNTIVLGSNNTGIELPSSQNEEIITVPSVPNFHTAYIRVKKGSSGIVTAKYTSAGIINDQELTMVSDDGTYTVYKAEGGGKVSDGNAHIIDFYLKDATVLQAAVSKDDKTVTAAGYATEAREYPLDFTLANTFGVNNGLSGANQKAYIVTGVDGENVTLQEVSYLPARAGVMMGSGVTSGSTEWPLFTTDVNRTTDVATNAVVRTEDGSGVSYTTVDMSANKLIGVITDPESRENVDQTTVVGGDTYYNYMLSAGGYVLKRTNDIWTVDMNDEINAVGFYLVIKEGTRLSTGGTSLGGKPNKNSAYLQLEEELAVHKEIATPSGARPYFLLDFGDDATGLQQVTTASSKKYGQNDAYYTLQGIRVDKPGKGLYLLNGKKVYVK